MTDHGPQRQPYFTSKPFIEDEIALVVEMNKSLSTELARLRAENERLRSALEKLGDESNWNMDYARNTGLYEWIGLGLPPLKLVADALRGEEGDDGSSP